MTVSLPASPSTVLFDLDGTLFDSSRPLLTSWTAALDAMGLPRLPRAELGRVIGPPMSLSAPEILAERGRGEPADVDVFMGHFHATLAAIEVPETIAYDGVGEVLAGLHADGRRLAVVTSKPRQAAEAIIPNLGFGGWFAHIEAPDQANPVTKDLTMALAVAALAPFDPDDTVMVGDRHHDVAAAAGHGVPTIGVTWGGFGNTDELVAAGAAAVVDTPAALAGLLGV